MAPRARTTIEGWSTLDRRTRSHINAETGEVLSDRQYRQRFLHPGKTLEKVKTGKPLINYNRVLRARQKYLASKGIKANLRDVRKSADMQSIVKTLKSHARELKRLSAKKKLSKAEVRKLYGPDSDLARVLVDLGYRDPNARYYVGDS